MLRKRNLVFGALLLVLLGCNTNQQTSSSSNVSLSDSSSIFESIESESSTESSSSTNISSESTSNSSEMMSSSTTSSSEESSSSISSIESSASEISTPSDSSTSSSIQQPFANEKAVGDYKGYVPGMIYIKENEYLQESGQTSIGPSTVQTITFTNDENVYCDTKNDRNMYYFNGEDMIFFVAYGTSQNLSLSEAYIGLYIKTDAQIDEENTYSLYTGPSKNEIESHYLQVALTNGEVKNVYFDFYTKNVKFNVSIQEVSGTGFIKNTIFEVKDEKNKTLKNFKIDTLAGQYDGKRHYCQSVKKDYCAGTFTGEKGDLVLDGFGKGTLNNNPITYTVSNFEIKITFADKKQCQVTVDIKTKTYLVNEIVSYVGKTYEGTFTEESYDDYYGWGSSETVKIIIQFTSESKVDFSLINYSNNSRYGTYVIENNLVKITFNSVGTLTLTPQENGFTITGVNPSPFLGYYGLNGLVLTLKE